MGQKQSGPQKDADQVDIKTSYYELLEVGRDATDDEIKKAYRRKALELHPDRNYGDVERATKLFADIQGAYEVLSDPQERAWYDSHEEAILGKASAEDGHEQYERDIGLTTAEDVISTVRNYNKNIQFSDGPSGFYGFLRDFFAQLVKEEEVAASRQDYDIPDWPSFGHKDDDVEDVKAFYSKWLGFSTSKSFDWRNYRIPKDAERAQRRYIENHNKRIREDAKSEFTQAVRSLVRFVRKRDPRLPQAKSEKEAEAQLREAVAAQKSRAQREKAERNAKLAEETVPEWVKTREPDEVVEVSDDESDEEHFECVACKKVFKSEKSWEAHEKSKKHIKTVQQLRRKLQKEGHELEIDEDITESRGETLTNGTEDAGTGDLGSLENETTDQIATDMAEQTGELHIANHEQDTTKKAELELQGQHSESEEDSGSEDEDAEGDTTANANSGISTPILDDNDKADDTGTIPKKGKAKQKREKRAAQQATATNQMNHRCAHCNASFPSRNRLFQHIKDWHDAAKVQATKAGKGKRK